jgi:hypothetical protein
MFSWLSDLFNVFEPDDTVSSEPAPLHEDWTSAFGVACPHQIDSEASSEFPSHEYTSTTFGDLGSDWSSSSSSDFGSGLE